MGIESWQIILCAFEGPVSIDGAFGLPCFIPLHFLKNSYAPAFSMEVYGEVIVLYMIKTGCHVTRIETRFYLTSNPMVLKLS